MKITFEQALELLNDIANVQYLTSYILGAELRERIKAPERFVTLTTPLAYEPNKKILESVENLKKILLCKVKENQVKNLTDEIDLPEDFSSEHLKIEVKKLIPLCQQIKEQYLSLELEHIQFEKLEKASHALSQFYKRLKELVVTESFFAESCQAISLKKEEFINIFEKAIKNSVISSDMMTNISYTYKTIQSFSNIKNPLEYNDLTRHVEFARSNNFSFFQSVYSRLSNPRFESFLNETLFNAIRNYMNYILPVSTEIEFALKNETIKLSLKESKDWTDFSNHLSKPLQRVCKYPLIMSDMSKEINAFLDLGFHNNEKKICSPKTLESISIRDAMHDFLTHMQHLAKQCNEKMKEEKSIRSHSLIGSFSDIDERKNDLLRKSVSTNNLENVILLIADGAKVNLTRPLTDMRGADSALINASKQGSFKIVRHMLENLDDLSLAHKEYAMLTAAINNHDRIVLLFMNHLLLKNDDPAVQDMILKVTTFGRVDTLRLLLNDLGLKDNQHVALYHACEKNIKPTALVLIQNTANALVRQPQHKIFDIDLNKIDRFKKEFFIAMIDASMRHLSNKKLTVRDLLECYAWFSDKNNPLQKISFAHGFLDNSDIKKERLVDEIQTRIYKLIENLEKEQREEIEEILNPKLSK